MKKFICAALALLFLALPLSLSVTALDGQRLSLPVVVGTRLAVGDDVIARLYIRVPDGIEQAYARINGTRIPAKATDEAGVFVVSYPGISFMALGRTLAVTPGYRVGGRDVEGEIYDFSPRDYAMRLLAEDETTPQLRRLLLAMLNFGAALQNLNATHLVNLADDYLTAEQKKVPLRPYQSVLPADDAAAAAGFYGFSLLAFDHVAIKAYVHIDFEDNLRLNGGGGIPVCQHMTPEEEAAAMAKNVRLEIADNPEFQDAVSCPLTKDANSTGYVATTPGIHVSDYATTFYLRLCYGEEGKEEDARPAMPCSIESYVASISTQEMDTQNGIMLRAMMEFCDAVCAYRASSAE